MAVDKVLNLIDLAAVAPEVDVAALGQEPLGYARADDSGFTFPAPVFLNRPEYAGVFAPVSNPERNMICAARDCFLLGPFGAVVLPTGQMIRQSVINLEGDSLQYSLAQFTGQFPGRHIPWSTAEAPVLAVNSYATNNYFHFLMDSFAQLHWQDRLSLHKWPSLKWIVSGYPPEAEATLPFIPQTFAAAHITPARLQPFDGTLLFCRTVIFPRRVTGADPVKVAFLRKCLGVDPKPGARFYVARGEVARRRLTNEAQVIRMLQGHGFSVINPGALTVREQADLFARAAVVVGAHGAALTNAAFMAPGGALVELTHEARVVRTYHEVAAASGLRYGVVIGATEGDRGQPVLADFSVDVGAVEAAVKAAT